MTGDRNMENTEHSSAYKDFFHQLDATGMERAYGGFAPDTLDRICDWERDEVERMIWLRFKNTGEGDLAPLVAKLTQYDGIEALNEKLKEGMISSEYSMRMVSIAAAAYEATSIEDYLDYVFEYYDKKQDNGALATLTYLKPCDKFYNLFKAVYLNSGDSTARSTAIDGMLISKGYIKDPMNFAERSELVGMKRAFVSDDQELRKKKLARFENGDFDNIPRTYGLYKVVSYEESIRMAKERKPEEEDPGEMVTGIVDATESGVYIVYYEPENIYVPSALSDELEIKPSVGDKVSLLKKKKGQSVIVSIEA